MEDKIKKVIQWMPVMEIPTSQSKAWKSLGGEMCGVYQFALAEDIEEIGDAIDLVTGWFKAAFYELRTRPGELF